MIPKKIHYCWFGGKPLPKLAEKCIASWKKYCPDYEIILWNESNYDFTKHPYMKQALDAKKWAFISDYARLDIVYQHGGIYLDTDVEIIKPLDPLLENELYMGFESHEHVNSGLGFGAEAGHPLIKKMMEDYDNYSFINEDGSLNLTTSPMIQTKFLSTMGLCNDSGKIQTISGCAKIYPSDFFAPKSYITNKIIITQNTYSIHHYDGSWLPLKVKIRKSILFFLMKKIGIERTLKLTKLKKKVFSYFTK